MSKIKKIKELVSIVDKLKKQNKKVVFTNGCFDIIHPGHIKILKLAKKQGDALIVGLNSDISIKKIKDKNRPIIAQKARALVLEGMESVDYIILFNEDTPYNLIKKLKPNILVKGADWNKGNIIGSDLVDKVYRVVLYPEYSTTGIINDILKKYGNKS